MPIGLSISSDHARPSLPIFLSLICLSGLKCWESKLPPLTIQLLPLGASLRTLASFTLPALFSPAAAALWRVTPNHSAQQSPLDIRSLMSTPYLELRRHPCLSSGGWVGKNR